MTRAIPNEEVFPFAAGWARGRELRDCDGDGAADGHRDARAEPHREDGRLPGEPGTNCIKIGLPGKGASIYDVRSEGGEGLAQKKM